MGYAQVCHAVAIHSGWNIPAPATINWPVPAHTHVSLPASQLLSAKRTKIDAKRYRPDTDQREPAVHPRQEHARARRRKAESPVVCARRRGEAGANLGKGGCERECERGYEDPSVEVDVMRQEHNKRMEAVACGQE